MGRARDRHLGRAVAQRPQLRPGRRRAGAGRSGDRRHLRRGGPMKVLISTDTVGGVLTYTAELAAALEAAGDEVVVATMGPRLRPAQREALPARVHESRFRLEWMEDPWDEVEAAGQWLLSLEEQEQPDVVHLCSYAHGALPFQAPKVLVAHSCVLSWWRAVHGTEAPTSWGRYREEMTSGLQAADAVVAPTAAMLRELERDHPL